MQEVVRMATVLMALGEYIIKLIIFAAVAAAGIAVGIKLRKNKNEKEQQTDSEI